MAYPGMVVVNPYRRTTLVQGELYGAGFSFSGIGRFIGGAVRNILGIPTPSQTTAPPPPTIPGVMPKLPVLSTPRGMVPAVPTSPVGAAVSIAQLVQQVTGLSFEDAVMLASSPPAYIFKILTSKGLGHLFPQVKALVAGAKGRHHRRINPLNFRALKRAGSRVEKFAKIARKYVTCHHGTKAVKFKKRR